MFFYTFLLISWAQLELKRSFLYHWRENKMQFLGAKHPRGNNGRLVNSIDYWMCVLVLALFSSSIAKVL